jgi:hypothetical protein
LSSRDPNLWRRKHPKEICRKLSARLPELQPNDLPGAGIEFPQARVRLLSHNRARVVVLETHPGDISIGIVMTVDSHTYRLAPPPDRHNASHKRIVAIRVLVGNHEAAGHDLPRCLALVTPPFAVLGEQRRLDIMASEVELSRLVERVVGPADRDRVDGHGGAGYSWLQSFLAAQEGLQIESFGQLVICLRSRTDTSRDRVRTFSERSSRSSRRIAFA